MISSWRMLTPELITACGALLIVIIDLLAGKRLNKLYPWITVLLAGAALVAVVMNCGQWGSMAPGMLVSDGVASFFKGIFLAATILVVMITTGYKPMAKSAMPEFYTLLLFATTGMMLMASATDVIMIFVAMELSSLSCYLLAAYLREDKESTEAGLKYFLTGAFSSTILLLGFSLLYGLSGQTNLSKIADVLSLGVFKPGFLLALGLVLVGLGFKMAIVPFQMWAPDTYQGAPTPITAYLSVASKASGVAVLVRVLWMLSVPLAAISLEWNWILAVAAALSMLIGATVGLWQDNLKRLLAYSSISHVGFVVMGIVAGSYVGLTGILVYLGIYLAMNLGAFAIIAIIGNLTGGYNLENYRGLSKRHPVLALALTVLLISLAGIPPTAGFIAKFMVFGSAIESGWAWLAIVGIIASVISVFMYARILRSMFFTAPPDEVPDQRPGFFPQLVVGFSSAVVLFFGVFPRPIMELAGAAARAFFPGAAGLSWF